jgi:hypothetical protein
MIEHYNRQITSGMTPLIQRSQSLHTSFNTELLEKIRLVRSFIGISKQRPTLSIERTVNP